MIAIPERDFGLCRRVDPAVGNRSTSHVAGEISGDGNSVRISLLNSHVPGKSTEPIQQRLHTGDRHRFGNYESTAMDCRFQRVTEFSSKDRHEHAGGEQCLPFQRDKPPLGVDPSRRDQTMDMRMDAQVSSPGVQGGNDSRLRSEILGVGEEFVE